MDKLQMVQFDLLKEFIRVCEKNHLRYYLFGGTCLGSIRHQGFIPWDDDVDLAMPRPDFDKLMKLGSEFSNPYFLQNRESNKHYIYTFAKLRNSNTTYIEYVFSHNMINHGVWIDIFPLDGLSKKKNKKELHKFKPYWIWGQLTFSYLYHVMRPIRFNKHFFSDIGLDLISLVFLPFNIFNWNLRVIELLEKSIPYDKATLVGPYETMYFNQEALPPSVFGDGVDAKFEGITVKVPSDYKTYLTHIYGDYMKLPPLEKQVGHHINHGLSLTMGYKDYFKEN